MSQSKSEQYNKEAMKLFAAGYRPMRNNPMPMIGKIDVAKVRRMRGTVNAVILQHVAGLGYYSKDIKNINSRLYYALWRISKKADFRAYELLAEQHGQVTIRNNSKSGRS